MKKFLIALVAWISKPFLRQPEVPTGESEIEELRAKLIELQDRLATTEAQLKTSQAGNKALQDFIAARHKPDKVLAEPPKIVKPFAVLAIAALTLCAQGAFPPPYVHNYWDTNLVPTDGSLITNAASARTLTDAAGLTNGIIPDPRYLGSAGVQSVSIGHSADASKDYAVAFGAGANASGTNSTAFGRSTSATALNSTALGIASQAQHVDSTAVGQNVITTGTNQIMLGLANGTVVIPGTLQTSGSGLTNLPALASVYPQAITNNDTRTVLVTGLSEIADTIFTTNMLAATNPTFWTNTTGRTVWAAVKGTGMTILLTTVSTYPNGPTNIMASTQGFLPARRNMVLVITNTTVTGNYLLSWPIN